MGKITVVNLGNESDDAYGKRLIVIAKSKDIDLDKKTLQEKTIFYMENDSFLYETPFHTKKKIIYNNIDKIVIKMCSRFYTRGFYSGFKYFIDLDIHVGKQIHKFEIQNIKTADQVIDFIEKLPIPIEDPVGVFEIFKKHPDALSRTRFLQSKFKKIAKKYELDNPRYG